MRNFSVLFDSESKKYRIIFQDTDDLGPPMFYVWVGIPEISDIDTATQVVNALNNVQKGH